MGSILIPELIKDGHFVYCLDRFFFGQDFLSSKKFKNSLQLIQDDIRWFDSKILDGIDVVMDLAALSNDPVGDLDPNNTYEINHLGRSRVAKLSKAAGVPKYILASSASIYGQQDHIATEESLVSPLTAYSKANRKAEIDIGYEVDPYKARILVNSEILLKINFNLILMLIKLQNHEKLTEQELSELKNSQDEISKFVKDRSFKNKLDLKYIKTESQEK